jgi:hypothetical protein
MLGPGRRSRMFDLRPGTPLAASHVEGLSLERWGKNARRVGHAGSRYS